MHLKTSEIIKSAPAWLLDLIKGRTIFGPRKDKVFLEVFSLGGMHMIENCCGLSFDKKHTDPNVPIKLIDLIKIREKILKDQRDALRKLRGSKIEISILKMKSKSGMLSGIVK